MQQQNLTLENKSEIESTYKKRCNFQKTKNKQSTNTPQRMNTKTTRCIEEIRHNCTRKQRTIMYKKYIRKPSNYSTERRIIKNSIRRTILE